jgi:O-antigen/teichoic acid export membrane protein
VGQQLASVLSTIVLVRLLAPSEFGIVVAANVVIAMVGLFTYLGIRLAVVRIPDLDDRTLWTLFWLSTALGVLTSAACVAGAGALADLMGVPESAPVLRVLGALIIVQTLSGVPRALLQRQMRFKAVYGVELVAAVGQAATAIVAALAGAGAWSLVLGYITHAVVLLVGYWGLVRRVPQLVFDRVRAREQVRFGAGMWTTTALGYVVRNADFWAVSRGLGTATLGVYYVAYVLPNVLRQRLTWVTSEVMLPSFATMQDDQARLRAVYQRSLRLHAAVGLPSMAGLAATSPLVVDLFFGDRWHDAAAPMSLVCLAAGVEFLTQPATNLLVALGRTGSLVGIQLGRVVVLVPGVFVAVRVSDLVAVSAVVLASAVITAVHAQVVCARRTRARALRQLLIVTPAVLASAAMGVTVMLAGSVLDALPAAVGLAALVAVGAATYPLFLFAAGPREARRLFADLRLMVRRSSRATPGGAEPS